MAEIAPESHDDHNSLDELSQEPSTEDITMTQAEDLLLSSQYPRRAPNGGNLDFTFNSSQNFSAFSAGQPQKRAAPESLINPATPRDRSKRRQLNSPQGHSTVETCLDDIQDLLTQANFLAINAEATKKKDLRELSNIFQEYIQHGTIRHTTSQLHLEIGRLTEVNKKIAGKILVPERVNANNTSHASNYASNHAGNYASSHAGGGSAEPVMWKMPGGASASRAAEHPRAHFTPDLHGRSDPSGSPAGRAMATGEDAPEPLWTTIIKAGGRSRPRSHSRSRQDTVTPSKTHKSRVEQRKIEEKSRNLIVFEAVFDATMTQMALRNHINAIYKTHNVTSPVIASVTRSLKGNIVLTTTPATTAQYLLDSESILKEALPHSTSQLDKPWHKVIVHGIPLSDFANPDALDLVAREISEFNPEVKTIGKPYWLKPVANRGPAQQYASAVVAFATEGEANNALRRRLLVGGRLCKVVKMWQTSKTTLCSHCHQFGHKAEHCKDPPTCALCAEPHVTAEHSCIHCTVKGRSCPHTQTKCVNCGEDHPSTSRDCPVLAARQIPLVPLGADW